MSILHSILINQEETHNIYELYTIHPTKFIIYNYAELLPNWNKSPHSIIIILLYSAIPLDDNSIRIKKEKNRLRQNFLQLGKTIQLILQKKQYLAEVIDPRDGKPISSVSGNIFFDSVAVVHKSLKINYIAAKKCKLLYHPYKKTSIYPGLIISNARVNRLNNLITASIP